MVPKEIYSFFKKYYYKNVMVAIVVESISIFNFTIQFVSTLLKNETYS